MSTPTDYDDTASLISEARGESSRAGLGTVIAGRYKLLGILGEGGFGVVYEADQRHPMRRRVALKVLKPGMDSKAVLARFEAERQALAVMDHPHIARVLDGGVTESGHPFFAMELVRGEPITDFCDKHKLTIRERIALFRPVCEAIQHAHAKGVIHRDIKPSNIIVEYRSDKGFPKVIDFGVAKALDQRLSEHTVFTQQGQIIGTPAYMSPEQAEMSALDIDTRTDVYSLGVVLYELLTGMTPFDKATLRRAAFNEIQRIIRDVDPPKPSTRLSGLKENLGEIEKRASIVKARRAREGDLESSLKRDLDWIVLRCLEKERERRYHTPLELEEDLRRFLDNEIVVARPPSASYRAQKFARRHWKGLTVSAAAFVLLAGGLVLTMALLDRALDAERLATTRLEDAREHMRRFVNESGRNWATGNAAISEPNLRAMWEWSGTALGPTDTSTIELGSSLVLSVGYAGEVEEMLDIAERGFEHAQQQDDTEALLRSQDILRWAYMQAAFTSPNDERRQAYWNRCIDTAEDLMQRSIDLFSEDDWRPPSFAASYAQALNLSGRVDEAVRVIDRWSPRIEEAGLPGWRYCRAQQIAGQVYTNAGRYEEAVDRFERALSVGGVTVNTSHVDYQWALRNASDAFETIAVGLDDPAYSDRARALRARVTLWESW